MIDPRDTRPHDLDTTVMGPGFFVFFNYGIIESGGFFDFPDRPPVAGKKKKRKIQQIIEEVAQRTEGRSLADQELALRLILEAEKIVYRSLYLKWLKTEAKKRRQRKTALVLLLFDN